MEDRNSNSLKGIEYILKELNGETYKGAKKNGRPHGQGTKELEGGIIYNGTFVCVSTLLKKLNDTRKYRRTVSSTGTVLWSFLMAVNTSVFGASNSELVDRFFC